MFQHNEIRHNMITNVKTAPFNLLLSFMILIFTSYVVCLLNVSTTSKNADLVVILRSIGHQFKSLFLGTLS